MDETDQHLNKMDPVLANQNSSGAFNIGAGKDTVDDGMIEGTLGSIARDAPLEVDTKPALKMKFDKLGKGGDGEKTDHNTGRLSNRVGTGTQGFNSLTKEKEPPGKSVQLHDNDIKIVTLPPKQPKDRIQVLDQ